MYPFWRFRMKSRDIKIASRRLRVIFPATQQRPVAALLIAARFRTTSRVRCGFLLPMPHQKQVVSLIKISLIKIKSSPGGVLLFFLSAVSRKCHKNEKRPRLRARRASCPRRTRSRARRLRYNWRLNNLLYVVQRDRLPLV